MPIPHLHTFDLILIVVYLIGITLFGLRFRKSGKDKSLRNYFLADNAIPWWAIALSIVSAETSTLTIISIPGVAFAGNFGFLQVVLGYMLGRVVVAALFLPRYFEGRMLTAYQLIDQRFGHTLHKVTAGLFLLTRAAAEGVRVFAVSIVVGIAIGTRDVLSIAIISALTLLYTFEGGMAAVIWTDVVQMVIYVGGTLVAIVSLGTHVPGGWQHIHEVAGAAGKFHLFNFALNLTQSYTFWAGVLGGTFLTMASHGTDQLMVQRMLAAKDLRESRLALLSSGVVIFFQFTLFLLIGAGLFVFYGLHPQTFASADRIFPTFIVAEMPIGIAGLLVAAILAAAMSNLSAALNSLSSATVVDFYMPWKSRQNRGQQPAVESAADERQRNLVSKTSTVLWAFVLFAIAVYSVQAGGKGHVVETGLSIASVAYGALLGVFLLGTLTKFVTETGAICGMIVGFAFNLYLWQGSFPISIGPITIPHIAFTWYVFLGAVITFVIGSIASLIFRKPAILMVVVLASLAVIPGSNSHLQAQSQAPDFTQITTLLNDAVAARKLPGAVVVVGHNGSVVFKQAYGNRKVAGEPGVHGELTAEPMTEDTLFDMASLSKCLSTATAIMQLYEAHKLDFDDPVAKYLPAFAANGKQNVTIRELLTHYSGLPPDVDLKDAWGLAAPDKAEGIRRAMASPLDSTPGTRFVYSDINYITLGALVEKLSGQTLDAYATQHIFLPLGMLSTTYHPFDKTCGPRIISGAATEISPSIDGDAIRLKCMAGTWTPIHSIPNTAPTAHDDELKATPSANPDFDHLLRGTVHDPTTRRMGGVAGQAGVFSTAADISLYAQALLDKLTRNIGPFPVSQATLKLMTQPEQPRTAESGATVFTPDGIPSKGIATRGFGWDLNTAYSRPRGAIFPIAEAGKPGSFGHTGFTGTSLWMDPTSNSYVILLANANHPRGAGSISALRGLVATAAAKALGLGGVAAVPTASVTTRTMTGIDVLEATHFAVLTDLARKHGGHLRLGVLTNQSGLDAQGQRTIDVLLHANPQIELTTLFSPEHGISGQKDSMTIGQESDPATRLPIRSLYGSHDADRRPKHDDLKNLDAVLIDLQDAGVRFYTYETVAAYFVEAAAAEKAAGHPLELIVLDRPSLIGDDKVQGPISDPPAAGIYLNYMPLPALHGMTLGELTRYINGEKHLNANLTVVAMQHWTRDLYYDQTGLPWVNPSPNLRSESAAVIYPGVAFVETTNLSVGRGTPTPFEQIGAPYIDAQALTAYLTGRHVAGVSFTATTIAIADDTNHYPYHGQTIPAIRITAVERSKLETSTLGIELLSALNHLYPEKFNLARANTIIGSSTTMQALTAQQDSHAIVGGWEASLAAFRQRRQPYLLYH